MITTQSKEIMITMTTITMIISTIIIKRIIILILILTMMTIVTITKGKETKLQLSSLIQMNVYSQQHNMINTQNKQGMFTKVDKFDKPQYMYPQEQNMMNFGMIRNNMFNPMAMPMNPFIPPQHVYPIRDEEILDVIEYLFSPKNLNRDIYLREAMDINGWVNAEILLMHPSRQLKIMNATVEDN